MTGRGRNYNQNNEWDCMKDDYNSSIYDPQYGDDDVSGGVNLDHCRLYIKNIPKALNDEGLRAAFAKFGTLMEVFISKDPQKNYGLIRYETPGEAKLAMMKMNRTEPLRLQINIAHKSKTKQSTWQDRNTNGGRDRSDRNERMSISNRDREESGSVVSRGRNSRRQENGGEKLQESRKENIENNNNNYKSRIKGIDETNDFFKLIDEKNEINNDIFFNFEDRNSGKTSKNTSKSDVTNEFVKLIKETSRETIDNNYDDDTCFLLSFRDEMKSMTTLQKIDFKIGMLELLKKYASANSNNIFLAKNTYFNFQHSFIM